MFFTRKANGDLIELILMVIICHYPKGSKDPGFSVFGVNLCTKFLDILGSGHHTSVGGQEGVLKSFDHFLAFDALLLFVKFYEGNEIVCHDPLIVVVWRRKRAGLWNPLLESVKSCSVGVAIEALPPRIKRKTGSQSTGELTSPRLKIGVSTLRAAFRPKLLEQLSPS